MIQHILEIKKKKRGWGIEKREREQEGYDGGIRSIFAPEAGSFRREN